MYNAQEKQVIHSTTVHHLLTSGQPNPQQQPAAPDHLPPVYILAMMFCGVEHPCGQFESAVVTMVPPRFLGISLLAELGKLEIP